MPQIPQFISTDQTPVGIAPTVNPSGALAAQHELNRAENVLFGEAAHQNRVTAHLRAVQDTAVRNGIVENAKLKFQNDLANLEQKNLEQYGADRPDLYRDQTFRGAVDLVKTYADLHGGNDTILKAGLTAALSEFAQMRLSHVNTQTSTMIAKRESDLLEARAALSILGITEAVRQNNIGMAEYHMGQYAQALNGAVGLNNVAKTVHLQAFRAKVTESVYLQEVARGNGEAVLAELKGTTAPTVTAQDRDKAGRNLVRGDAIDREVVRLLSKDGGTVAAHLPPMAYIRPEDLPPEKRIELIQKVRQQMDAQYTEEQRQAQKAKQAVQADQQQTQNTFIAKITKNELKPSDILASNLDPEGPGSKEHYLALVKARTQELNTPNSIKSDPAVFAAAVQQIRQGKLTTEAEVDALYFKSAADGRGVTWDDTEDLRKEVQEMRTPEGRTILQKEQHFLNGVKAQIDKSNPLQGKIDNDGQQKFNEFSEYVKGRVDAFRREKKDPHLLFDEKSPEYLGKPSVLAPYQKTMQESIRDGSMKWSAPPALTVPSEPKATPSLRAAPDTRRKPGETIDQFLKRQGK